MLHNSSQFKSSAAEDSLGFSFNKWTEVQKSILYMQWTLYGFYNLGNIWVTQQKGLPKAYYRVSISSERVQPPSLSLADCLEIPVSYSKTKIYFARQ